jgi:hypothetical protein
MTQTLYAHMNKIKIKQKYKVAIATQPTGNTSCNQLWAEGLVY